MIHSNTSNTHWRWWVVNWFQIDTFMWWFTVPKESPSILTLLWIDFKLILLCDDSQYLRLRCGNLTCCELISNWYFYVMIHSTNKRLRFPRTVVNWFQIDTFMWWFTVHAVIYMVVCTLWIDFKLILLCDDSQFIDLNSINITRCELISNWYFYVMIHSR